MPSSQQTQSYSVYVDPLPDYATSYASNVIYDATNAWSNANPNIKFYKADTPEQADLEIQWVKEYADTTAGEYVTGTKLIQVSLGDSHCMNSWQPYSSHYLTHVAEHEIGHFLGLGHSTDPTDIMYPTAPVEYGEITIEKNLAAGYDWFIPACTTKDVTSFSYSIKYDEPTYGFNVYFVPSKDEFTKYGSGVQFQYYSADGCSAKNYLSFSATCNGVAQGSGLLIIMPNQLSQSLTTVTVKLDEQSSDQSQSAATLDQSSGNSYVPPSTIPQPTPTPQPEIPQTTPQTPQPTSGFVKVDQSQYIVSVEQTTEVMVSGQVAQFHGGRVSLTLSEPDGTTEQLTAGVTSAGYFSAPFILDNKSPLGQYQMSANYLGSDLGSTSFNVVSDSQSQQNTPQPQNNTPKPSSIIQFPTNPQLGLQPGEWIKYNLVTNVNADNDYLKQIANAVLNVKLTGTNYSISDVDWYKVSIDTVQGTTYTYDITVHTKDGREITTNNISGDLINSNYILVVPTNLQVGNKIPDFFGTSTAEVLDTVTKQINGNNMDVFEIITNNNTSQNEVTTTTQSNSLYDKATGILLRTSANILMTTSLGIAKMGFDIDALDSSKFSSISNTSTQTSSTPIIIPTWIKNNAKWWSQGNIGDDDFEKGIQYLIKQGIIKTSATTQSSSITQIPLWIRNMASWWADGKTSDSDFVKGLEYLVRVGIIKV